MLPIQPLWVTHSLATRAADRGKGCCGGDPPAPVECHWNLGRRSEVRTHEHTWEFSNAAVRSSKRQSAAGAGTDRANVRTGRLTERCRVRVDG